LYKEYFSLTGHSFNEIHSHKEIIINILSDQKEAIKLRKSITKQKDKVETLDKNDPLNYKVEINGVTLSKQILQKREWIETHVININKTKPSVKVIKGFIYECKEIIDAASNILSNIHFITAVGFDENKIVRKSFESTRFKLPIEKIFDTGINIAVLGEAGAGKSTSLQMYAINRECSSEKLFICVPLANVTQLWQKQVSEFSEEQKVLSFDESIAGYLIYKGIQMTKGQFLYFLGATNTVLMLDGIDEAIKLNPWLPKAINQLSKKYQDKMQLIVTSRMSGSYHNELSFFSVTLLPFTTEQRNKFIDNWFEKEDNKIADRIKKHLTKNKSINEIVKNPLLTTTLCVLAKNDVDLPNTEIKLYDDRISLLAGYYDAIKGIESRIASKPQTLERVAQKLAYCLHLKGKREAEKSELKSIVINMPLNALSKIEIDLAINELIDPCNILVPMTDDGKFGFGHLRYQEHLAAKELTSNRSIDLLPLLENIWWRGALILFAQMNSSLLWLFNDVSIRGNFSAVQESLKEMIKASPRIEQDDLTKILKTWVHIQNKIQSQDSEFELEEFLDS
jgi:NACHT domain